MYLNSADGFVFGGTGGLGTKTPPDVHVGLREVIPYMTLVRATEVVAEMPESRCHGQDAFVLQSV